MDYLSFFFKALMAIYVPTSITMETIKTRYITGTETRFPKKYTLQSIPSFIEVITSAGICKLSISKNAPFIAWVLSNEVPYVPGKKEITFCNPLLNEEMGIYAPQINP